MEKKTRLGNVAKVISGYAFKSSQFSDNGSVPVIKIKNIKIGRTDLSEVDHVDSENLKINQKYHVTEGDILISLTGSHMTQPNSVVGRVGLYQSGLPRALLNQRAGKVIPISDNVDKTFLFYTLLSVDSMKEIAQMAHGAASQANVSPAQVESLEIFLPNIDKQKEIGGILSAYDSLIENNNRRIAILENMAQSLYREWFVNFRFPDHENCKFVDSALGRVPEGWKYRKVSSIIERRKSGNVYHKDDIDEDGEVMVVDQSRSDVLGYHSNAPDHIASPENPIAIFGDHTCKMQIMVQEFSVGPNVVPFVPNIDRPLQYVFFLVNSLVSTKEYKRHWTELNANEVLVADKHVSIKYSEFVTSLIYRINTLKKSNLILGRARDMLLPRLVGGQINLSAW